VALALVILLAAPLLLFNPWFTAALQDRHQVAARLGTSDAEVDRVTASILADIYTVGEFSGPLAGGEPLLNERERSHMRDVARLVRVLWLVLGVSAAVVALSGFALAREPRRLGGLMVRTAAAIGAAGLALGIAFAVAFEPTFLAFHAIFFPPGTYLFEPGSELIALFPEGFWFEAALAAGIGVVLTAVVAGVIGWRLARGPEG
jgi:integral membrane protein (TIGR01906 family)